LKSDQGIVPFLLDLFYITKSDLGSKIRLIIYLFFLV